MGQGIRTGWAMVVADELEADIGRLKVQQAPGDEARYGSQDTDGSRSMRHHFDPLRRIAAATRLMLEQEAAARWNVPVSEVKAANHEVVHAASGRRLGFGALAKGAAARPVPSRQMLVFKAPDRYRYIGRSGTQLVDNFDITTGAALYGIDARPEGLVYAVIARPPVFGGKVKSFDAAETMKVPGVLKVVPIDGPRFRRSSSRSAALPWWRRIPLPPSRDGRVFPSSGTTGPMAAMIPRHIARPWRQRRRRRFGRAK